jgi:hypothetical protein
MSIQNAAGNAANCTYVASAIFDCIMREVRILNVAGDCCDCWQQEHSKCGGSYRACSVVSRRFKFCENLRGMYGGVMWLVFMRILCGWMYGKTRISV